MAPRTRKPIRRLAVRATLVGLVGGLSVAVGFGLIGSRLVRPANTAVGPPPADLDLQTVAFPSASGAEVRGWLADAVNQQVTVLLLHPLRANRLAMVERARVLVARGYGVLLIDLQAHGETPGEAITFGWRERHDVVAAVEFLRERRPEDRVYVLGRSLGGAAAALALPLEIDGLVLESVYPTIDEAIANRVRMRVGPLEPLVSPGLRFQLATRLGVSADTLRPIDRLARAACPVLILAGDRDRRTPESDTQRLFDSAEEPKKLVWFAGAAHQDLYRFDQALWESSVADFVREGPVVAESAAISPATR